jgi:hypothetical protein
VTPPGIDPGTAKLVAHRLNHYATPGPPVLVVIPIKQGFSAYVGFISKVYLCFFVMIVSKAEIMLCKTATFPVCLYEII